MDQDFKENMKLLQKSLSRMKELCSIKEQKLSWRQTGIKYPFAWFKQLARKVFRWLMKLYIHQQTEFNTAAVGAVGHIENMISKMSEMVENNGSTIMPKKDALKIVQIVQSVQHGDAVSNEILTLYESLKNKGIPTEIYAFEMNGNDIHGGIKHISSISKLNKNDIVIYHFAFLDSLSEIIQKLNCIKVLRYHNVTPPRFFEKFNNTETMQGASLGLKQIKEMRNDFNYVMADSEFNKSDLLDMGYGCPVYVVPILICFEDYMKKPSEKIINSYSDGVKNILFVGRIVPNKKIEDVISAYDYYQKKVDAKTRLFIVGSYNEKDSYFTYLREHIKTLKAQNVIFTGHVTFEEILGYYHVADAFLCMSEHEGFCVPIVEAMFFKIPIVAYASTAVPDTMGKCGILLKTKKTEEAAEGLKIVLNDRKQIETIKLRETEHIMDFGRKTVEAKIFEILQAGM